MKKTKTSKPETKNQRNKRARTQYAIIKNKFGDTKEAYRASKLSPTTFFQTYGVKITKSTPKIKQYQDRTYKKNLKEWEEFKRLRDSVLEEVKIQKQKISKIVTKSERKIAIARVEREKKRKIKNAALRKKLPKTIKSNDYVKENPSKMSVLISSRSKAERRKLWGSWVSNQNFPDYIMQMIARVNLRNGFDLDAPYGWAVVYAAVRNGKTPEEIEKEGYIAVSKYSQGDFYKTVREI